MIKMMISGDIKSRGTERPKMCQKRGETYKMAVSGITGKRTIEKEYRLARNVVKSAQTTISGTTDSSTTEESL